MGSHDAKHALKRGQKAGPALCGSSSLNVSWTTYGVTCAACQAQMPKRGRK